MTFQLDGGPASYSSLQQGCIVKHVWLHGQSLHGGVSIDACTPTIFDLVAANAECSCFDSTNTLRVLNVCSSLCDWCHALTTTIDFLGPDYLTIRFRTRDSFQTMCLGAFKIEAIVRMCSALFKKRCHCGQRGSAIMQLSTY